jgi:phosphoribosyl 1,2-cyclic phosphate phosphodiesterase
MLEGLECWVIDALRHDPHPTHFHLDRALAEIERFKPKKSDIDQSTCRLGLSGFMQRFAGKCCSGL